jgi:hypothetical protein
MTPREGPLDLGLDASWVLRERHDERLESTSSDEVRYQARVGTVMIQRSPDQPDLMWMRRARNVKMRLSPGHATYLY